MARLPSGFWGPPFRWAVIPLAVVGMVLGWVAFRQSKEGDQSVAVTALKPVGPAGDEEAEQTGKTPPSGDAVGIPIEVRYGVPSPRTARLWAEPRPG